MSPLDDDTTPSGATAQARDGAVSVASPTVATDPVVAEIVRVTDQLFDEIVDQKALLQALKF